MTPFNFFSADESTGVKGWQNDQEATDNSECGMVKQDEVKHHANFTNEGKKIIITCTFFFTVSNIFRDITGTLTWLGLYHLL